MSADSRPAAGTPDTGSTEDGPSRKPMAAPVTPNGGQSPVAPAMPSQSGKPFDLAVFRARCLYWLWTVTTKSLLSVVYLALISQGLRYVLPDIGMRLWKLPGLAIDSGFEIIALKSVGVSTPTEITPSGFTGLAQ